MMGISLRMRAENSLLGAMYLLIKRCCCRGLDLQLAWESRWVQPLSYFCWDILYTPTPEEVLLLLLQRIHMPRR